MMMMMTMTTKMTMIDDDGDKVMIMTDDTMSARKA